MVQLKVIAVSSNTNSFGLRSMIMISNHGQTWEALANSLNQKAVDTVLTVPDGQDIATFLTLQSLEVPQQLVNPPDTLMDEIWP